MYICGVHMAGTFTSRGLYCLIMTLLHNFAQTPFSQKVDHAVH